MKKAEIKYPCQWTYRIIGMDENELRQVVINCLGEQAFELSLGNTSKKGKYISLNLETEVDSQQQRDELFNRLNENPEVKMII